MDRRGLSLWPWRGGAQVIPMQAQSPGPPKWERKDKGSMRNGSSTSQSGETSLEIQGWDTGRHVLAAPGSRKKRLKCDGENRSEHGTFQVLYSYFLQSEPMNIIKWQMVVGK